jgi:hypothetical protein
MYTELSREVWRERTTWRHRHRYKYNVKMDMREICLDGVDWIHLPHDSDQWRALLNPVVNLQIP